MAPTRLPEGASATSERATPQRGVVSPLLAKLFLHYALDRWLRRAFPQIPFERYADDVITHCRALRQVGAVAAAVQERLSECRLAINAQKIKIVYSADSNRRESYPQVQPAFLGFAFRPRMVKNRWGKLFTSFLPAVSPRALLRMRQRVRSRRILQHPPLPLEDIARFIDPMLRGW